jgi:hypothetical protein
MKSNESEQLGSQTPNNILSLWDEIENKALSEISQIQSIEEYRGTFGGDGFEDIDLCILMLKVVINLFGDIDYIDEPL